MSPLIGKITTVSFIVVFLAAGAPHVQATSEFQWTELEPSESLNWSPCYSGLQCARLQVPLDYSAPDNGVAAIALVKYPSTVPKSQYLGPILFNPGGPGGSGVDTIVASGSAVATVLGAQFDLVGFDPRGVSYSTPIISFFRTDAERSLWSATAPPSSLNSSDTVIQAKWARSQLLGTLAKERDVAKNVLPHITTDNVARDMLRITEAFGFPKLQYYGVSYGSVLGATFASLFPDKVGRLVIDGVVDADSWFVANLTSSMEDTDKALQTFFDGCAAAGPEACAFYAPTAADIAANLAALTNALKNEPIPVITNVSYGLFDFSLLRSILLSSLYSPYERFQPLAQGLAQLATGDAGPLYALAEAAPFECPKCGTTAPVFHDNSFDANLAVLCGDGTAVTDSVSQLRDFYTQEAHITSFADLSVNRRVSCSGWKVHREGRFLGPAGAANTSFPLLVIRNTADPVTPLSSARKIASAFPGAALLTQDSPGHTSTAAQSLCIYLHVGQYFQNGTLPAVGTVCPVNQELFPGPSASTAARRSTQNSELLEAGRQIGEAVRPILLRTMGV